MFDKFTNFFEDVGNTIKQAAYGIGYTFFRIDGFHGTPQEFMMYRYSQFDKAGVCYGLVMDAARHHLKHYGTDKNDFVAKLSDKLYGFSSGANFEDRIVSYQAVQMGKDRNIKSIEHLKEALEHSLFSNSKFIGIAIYGQDSGHDIGIKVSNVAGEKSYTVYDPNFGESKVCKSTDEIAKVMKNLVNNVYPDLKHSCYITDLDKQIQNDYKLIEENQSKDYKYAYACAYYAVTHNDLESAKYYQDIDQEAICRMADKSVSIESLPHRVASPLHAASVCMNTDTFNTLLALTNLHFDNKSMLAFHIFLRDRASKFSSDPKHGLNDETFQILYSKLSTAGTQLSEQEAKFAYTSIEVLKNTHLGTGFTSEMTSSDISNHYSALSPYQNEFYAKYNGYAPELASNTTHYTSPLVEAIEYCESTYI